MYNYCILYSFLAETRNHKKCVKKWNTLGLKASLPLLPKSPLGLSVCVGIQQPNNHLGSKNAHFHMLSVSSLHKWERTHSTSHASVTTWFF